MPLPRALYERCLSPRGECRLCLRSWPALESGSNQSESPSVACPLTPNPSPALGRGEPRSQRFFSSWASLLPGLTFGQVLPGTQPLDWQGDLSERMMDGAHRFVERKIGESVEKRQRHWKRDFSSRQAYEASVEPNRQRLKKIIGVVDSRLPARMERFGDDENPALVAETPHYRIFQVRWPVLEGVTGEGLLLEPKVGPAGLRRGTSRRRSDSRADCRPCARRRARSRSSPADWPNGASRCSCRCSSIAAAGGRAIRISARPIRPHREWIYRQAFHMGRHVIGYEVQKVLAAVDWFKAKSPAGQGWRRWLW